MEFKSSKLNFFKLNKRYLELTDVIINPSNGSIMDKDGKLIDGINYESVFWQEKALFDIANIDNETIDLQVINNRLKNLDAENKILLSKHKNFVDVNNGVFLIHPLGFYPYGHLYDSLQRLYSIRDILINLRHYIFLVSDHRRVRNFDQHLHLSAGFSCVFAEQRKGYMPINVKNLIFPVSSACYTNFTTDTLNFFNKRFEQYFTTNSNSSKYKLYLSRNHVRIGERSVTNENEVKNLLKSRGFKIIYGDEDLKSIFDYFRNAELIIGAHGSLFANTFLCNEDCQIIEYCPKNRVDFSFKSKLKYTKNYNQILVPASENFNIEINLNELNQYIC